MAEEHPPSPALSVSLLFQEIADQVRNDTKKTSLMSFSTTKRPVTQSSRSLTKICSAAITPLDIIRSRMRLQKYN